MPDLRIETEHGRLCGIPHERVFDLLALHVDDAHRNGGIGTTLLHALSVWCIDKGIKRIDVDDMSDRHRDSHNIYVNCGFAYRGKVGPEMYASPKTVVRRTAHGKLNRPVSFALTPPCAL